MSQKTTVAGVIKHGNGTDATHNYVWSVCPQCDKGRWLQIRGEDLAHKRCHKCYITMMRENHPNWRGGRTINNGGYVLVRVPKEDFFYPMVNAGGYAMEHRLVMAEHMKRNLLPWEVVHHKNGKRADNDLANLMLLPSQNYHVVDLRIKSYIKQLENKINKQEIEIAKLQKQVNDSVGKGAS